MEDYVNRIFKREESYYSNEPLNIKFKYERNIFFLVRVRQLIPKMFRTRKHNYKLVLDLLKWFNRDFEKKKKFDSIKSYDNIGFFKLFKIFEEYNLNCRLITYIFTILLISLGFRARFISCIPLVNNKSNRHCVCEVYLNEFNKWVLIDPSLNLIYFNVRGSPLNLLELQYNILNDIPVRCFLKYDDYDYIIKLWKECIFRFEYLKYNNKLMLKKKKVIILNPINFLSNIELNNYHNRVINITSYNGIY